MSPVTVITNYLLDRLLKDSRFTEAFPFLATPVQRPAKSCCRGKNKMETDYNQLRQQIVGLSSDRVRVFCRLLNTQKIKLSFKNSAGKFDTKKLP